MKNKKAKMLSTILAIGIIASALFSGCSRTTEDQGTATTTFENTAVVEITKTPTEEAPTIGGKIIVWHALGNDETKGLYTSIRNFQSLYPSVEFEVLFVPFNDLRNAYQTAVETGGGPDLMIGSDEWGPSMYDAELIQDLSEIQAENIPAAAWKVGQYDGAQIGLPYRLSGVVLYRNQSIIAAPAADFADLKAKAEAATTEEIDGALLEIGSFYSFGHLYGLGGALMTPEGDPAFNTPEGVAWLEMLQDFYALGADEWYSDDDIERFKEGKVGFVIDGTWNMADFSARLGDDLVIDPWPADMSGFVQTSMLYLNANTTGENTGAVKAFMAYLLEEESQTTFYEADETFLPANTRVEVPDPLRQQALAALEGGVSWIVIPEMGAYWGPTENAIRLALQTDADLAAVLAETEQIVIEAVAEIRAVE